MTGAAIVQPDPDVSPSGRFGIDEAVAMIDRLVALPMITQ